MSSSGGLEESISDFFSKAIGKTFGGSITPVPVQGICGYTVTNGTTIIQFREPESPLDTQVVWPPKKDGIILDALPHMPGHSRSIQLWCIRFCHLLSDLNKSKKK